MANIDNLEIVVTANADQAARALDRLTASASRVKGAASQAAGGMRDAADGARDMADAEGKAGDEAQKAEKPIRRSGQAAQDAGKNAKKGTNGLVAFWTALKRIAFYRVVRSVLKEIAAAFKEGITNLYHWSAAVNGHFAKSMDRLATSTQYFKNSLAAMVSPLIESFIPMLEWIIDRLVTAMNYVNMFFAALSGASTYTVAKKAAAAWDDTTKSVKSAGKEAKRTLLAFDEINKLDKPTTSSGGTSGKKQPNYGAMFEEKPLEGFLKKISDVTSKLPPWLRWLLTGTALVGGFLLLKKFIPWLLKKIGQLFKMTIPNWLKWLFGPKGTGGDKTGLDVLKDLDIPDGKIKVTLDPDAISNPLSVPVKPANDAKDLFDMIRTHWYSLATRVLYFIPKFDNSALALYRNFKDDWSDLPSHTLYFSPKMDNSAVALYRNFRDDWNDIPSHTLYFSPKLDNSAAVLSKNFRDDWNDLPTNTVYLTPKLNNAAKVLYDNFKREWESVGSKVLYFSPALSNSAAVLYKNFKDAWDASGSKTLYFSPKLNNSAKVLYDNFKSDWDHSGSKTLYFAPKMNNNASVLYNNFKTDWDRAGSKILYFAPAFSNTAQALYNQFIRAWDSINTVLYMTAKIATLPKALFDSFRKEWIALPGKSLYMTPKFDNTARVLFNNFKKDWNRITSKTLYMSPKLDNTAAAIFKAFKDAWNSAKTPLEVAITLTKSGWSTISGYLDDNFGGATGGGGGTSGGGAGRSKGSSDHKYGVNVNLNSPTTNDVSGFWKSLETLWDGYTWLYKKELKIGVDAYGAWDKFRGGLMQYLGIDNLWTSIKAAISPGWSGNPLKKLGLTDLETTVKVGVTAKKGSGVELVQQKGGAGGKAWMLYTKALGGILSNGLWSKLPQYAGGTLRAGSVFAAGESGPELVGHVNGRTEVLNKSQLAAAMYSAVNAAMAPAATNFAAAAYSMANGAQDTEDMGEMLGVLREQNNLLRIISEKEFSSEVTTGDIARAMSRYNRRAGTTVVPVG